jgi:hypothetical protein
MEKNMSIHEFIANITLEEIEKIRELKLQEISKTPTLSFSKIDFDEIEKFLKIERDFSQKPFKNWFENSENISSEELNFLEKLSNRESLKLHLYKEEDLKAKFIIPILNLVDFTSGDIRDFYEANLSFSTNEFSLNGTVDFVVAKGFDKPKKPIFFIQEFKRGRDFSDPEPQLISEMFSGLNISKVSKIYGAYIIGAVWNFVILEKVEERYSYYVSRNFDSSDFEKLKSIYKNLLFIKNEVMPNAK